MLFSLSAVLFFFLSSFLTPRTSCVSRLTSLPRPNAVRSACPSHRHEQFFARLITPKTTTQVLLAKDAVDYWDAANPTLDRVGVGAVLVSLFGASPGVFEALNFRDG